MTRQDPPQPGVYRCATCGGDAVELAEWVALNSGAIRVAASSAAWCPSCREHGVTLCYVDPAGACTFHGRPFTDCRAATA